MSALMERYAWIGLAALGIGMGALIGRDSVPGGVLIFIVLLAMAYWLSPWRGGRSVRHGELESLPPEDRRVVIYWRPGCMYCARLKRALGRDRNRATWINIWQDDRAAEFVRSVNDGNEVVPTVVIDGTTHTNPNPELVRHSLTS